MVGNNFNQQKSKINDVPYGNFNFNYNLGDLKVRVHRDAVKDSLWLCCKFKEYF